MERGGEGEVAQLAARGELHDRFVRDSERFLDAGGERAGKLLFPTLEHGRWSLSEALLIGFGARTPRFDEAA
jgi:hypothetical protein